MTDCSKIPTLTLVEDSKKAMNDTIAFAGSPENAYTSGLDGSTRETITGLTVKARNAYRLSSDNPQGNYAVGVFFNESNWTYFYNNEYWGLSDNFDLSTLPYEATQTDPNNDSNLQVRSNASQSYVQERVGEVKKRLLSSDSALSNYRLVGTFEDGAVLNSASDVVSDGVDVWIYRRFDFPKTIPAGSSPTPEGEYNWKKLEIFPAIRNASDIAYRLEQGENLRFELYGDSTMWGSVSDNPTVQETNHPGSILQNTMNILFDGTITVTNNAIAGSSLRSMMRGIGPYPEPFDTVMASSTADVVFSNHCQNDMNNNAGRVDQFIDDLKLFVTTVRKYGKVPILVTPNTTFFDVGITEQDTKRIKSFVDAIKFVASEMSVDVVDVYDYFIKTSKDVPMSELVPDGVHPSAKAYGITGRNMAMPFVSVATLSTPDDSQGFSNISYNDDATNARVLQVSASKFGNTLVYKSDATLQRVHYPIILEKATVDYSVALYGLQWSEGGTAAAINDNTSAGEFSGIIDMYHPTAIDWNALFVPETCDMYAGLQVIGLIAGSVIDQRNNKVGLSGVTLVPKNKTLTNTPQLAGAKDYIFVGDTILYKFNLDASSTQELINLTSVIDANEWLLVTNTNGTIDALINGVTTQVGSGVGSAVYDCQITLGIREVTVKIGGLTVDIPTTHIPTKSLVFQKSDEVKTLVVQR